MDEIDNVITETAEVEEEAPESLEEQFEEPEADSEAEAEAEEVEEIPEEEDSEADEDEEAEAPEEDAEAEDEPEAKPSEEPEDEEPIETADARRNRRLASEVLKLAKAKGYDSVEQMIADELGESLDDVNGRVSSDEMTVEEKAAAYDRMHSKKADADRQAAGKAVHDRLLSEIHSKYPETVNTLKSLDDVPNLENFRRLVLVNKLNGAEAYAICAGDRIRAAAAKATKPSGKAHLRPDSKRSASGNTVPDAVVRQMKELYPDMSAAEIRKIYTTTL